MLILITKGFYDFGERKPCMQTEMTHGPIMRSMLSFAAPMVLGNLLQQCYNIADTLIVGRYLGSDALAAVGSSFTLMTFLTSILLGLCMGSGAFFSIRFGEKDEKGLKDGVCASFVLILSLTVILNIVAFILLDKVKIFMNIPSEVWEYMRDYLAVIFCGIFATFLYNYFASLLRAVGNSVVPLVFLAASAVLNIGLDFLFVLVLKRGVSGAAEATLIAQYLSGIGIVVYSVKRVPYLKLKKEELRIKRGCMRKIMGFSILTCIQQSVMNLGILLVQGIVNSFGSSVMTAFAAAVKIDAFAYMPVQDFGNAFSTFIAQNYGAKKPKRIRRGLKGAAAVSMIFCAVISAAVWIFANPLMRMLKKQRSSRRACVICISRALFISGSGVCSCCTDFIGRWASRVCRWCLPCFPSERVCFWRICFPPFPKSEWRGYGGRFPSAGFWRMRSVSSIM